MTVSHHSPVPPAAPKQPFSFWRDVVVACLVGLTPVVVMGGFVVFSPTYDLVEDDGISLAQPLMADGLRQFYSGRLPFWSHHSGCGYPLLARPAGQGLLYPPHHLSYALCALFGLGDRTVLLSYLLHAGLAAFTAYLFLRSVGVRPAAATLGAIPFGLNGPVLGMLTNWNDYVYWLPYLPLVLLIVERLRGGDRSWLWPALSGLLGSLTCLAAGPVGAIKVGLFGGLYWLARWDRRTAAFSAGRLAVAGVLAFLGCCGQLWATHEWVRLSNRLPDGGVHVIESLGVMACAPEFYRGFVYPFVEFFWNGGFNWELYPDERGRFHGVGVFVSPWAPLAVLLAAGHFLRRPGLHRPLLLLVGVYCVLSLGFYWTGNLLLTSLPFFRHYRWVVRWTLEFSAAAALLTGVALELGGKGRDDGTARRALIAFLVVTLLAVTLRWGDTSEDASGGPVAAAWLAVVGVACYLYWNGRRAEFYAVAIPSTVLALALAAPVAQAMRWGRLKPLHNAPLDVGRGSQERVLCLLSQREQRAARGEGNLAYCLPHQYDTRVVLTYGPFPLQMQAWQTGISMFGVIQDEEAAIQSFLRGHLLETLRVGHVVVPRDNAALNRACREHPHLRLDAEHTWKTVYRHVGFRDPAFFVRRALPEADLPSWDRLGEVPLSEVCYLAGAETGPRTYSGAGRVQDFREDHGRLSMSVACEGDQLLVVTTTAYPGWRARIDGRPAPVRRVNGSFLALEVPAGAHEVRFEFWPEHLVYLILFNAAVLAGMAGVCAASGIRQFRRGTLLERPTDDGDAGGLPALNGRPAVVHVEAVPEAVPAGAGGHLTTAPEKAK